MIDGIEPYYQQIAQALEDAIPEPWLTASVDAIFFSEANWYEAEYLPAQGGQPKSIGMGRGGQRAFEELREKFREAGKQVWGRARFELHSSGKFSMKWGYDDCDENGFARFDEESELQRRRERFKRLTE